MTTTVAYTPIVGELAPVFALADETGKVYELEQYRGERQIVLVFYPGDDTPGCVKQLCAVRDDWREFEKRNAIVLGVNHAGAESHQKFIGKYGLKNPLLIDEGRRVASMYGAVGKFFGNETTKRTVVVIGREGVIRYYKHGMPPNSEIFEALDRKDKNEE